MSIKNTWLILIIVSSMINITTAQTPDALYNFNGCDFKDNTSTYADAVSDTGFPLCECGVDDDGLRFTGTQSLTFPDIDMALVGDFTLSFYFWPQGNSPVMNIISITNDSCIQDSTMVLNYIQSSNQLKFEISEKGSRRIGLEGTLDDKKCWHHVVIVNKGKQYDLYIDEQRVDSKSAVAQFKFAPSTRLKISNHPCASKGIEPFVGLFDELMIWEQALEQTSIIALNQSPDKIITEDQIVFLGDQIQIETGGTCATNFNWTPNSEFIDPTQINPILEPTVTQEYVLEVNYATCFISDSITIYVVDPNDIDCEQLLLPKAFTPNNDGLNELFGISNDYIVTDLNSFEILDRWGNIMFQTTSITEKWDGSFQGTALNPGLFVYKISYECGGKTYNKLGSFTMLK